MSEIDAVLTEGEKVMVLVALRHQDSYLCKLADHFPSEVSNAIVADALQIGELHVKISSSKFIRLQGDAPPFQTFEVP